MIGRLQIEDRAFRWEEGGLLEKSGERKPLEGICGAGGAGLVGAEDGGEGLIARS